MVGLRVKLFTMVVWSLVKYHSPGGWVTGESVYDGCMVKCQSPGGWVTGESVYDGCMVKYQSSPLKSRGEIMA